MDMDLDESIIAGRHFHAQRLSHNTCELCASHSLLASNRWNTLMAVPISALPSTNVEKVVYSATVHTAANDPNRHDSIHRGNKKSLDEAYDFLCTHEISHEALAIDIKRLRRKVDWHVVPLFYLNYMLQFLDKFLFSYAIVMGMPKDIHLKGNELNNCASSLWWSYLVASVFVGPILNKVPVARFCALGMTCWGIIVACLAAVQSYGGLMGCRVLMGIFDAFIPPALMLLTSQWYQKNEAALRFELWFTAVGSGIIFGGFISFGFQHVHTTSLESWRIMFLVLGTISIMVGVLTWIFLPDTPMKARFLSDAEKAAIIKHVSVNETGISSHKFERSQILACVTDPQVWILFIGTIVISTAIGVIAVYGVSLIRSFGYDSKDAALLNTPTGAVGFVCTVIAAFVVRYGWLPRWAVAIGCYIPAFIGTCLLAFISKSNKAGNLIGIWLIATNIPSVGIKYHWITANVAGHTKRSLAAASLSAAFAIGNIIGPYAVQKKDAPDFQPARITMMACSGGAIVLMILLVIHYWWANRRRDKMFGPPPKEDDASSDSTVRSDTWANLTDTERKTFRYVF